jgi:ADP-L-glycero-D-manno-heptose 6-epimerase
MILVTGGAGFIGSNVAARLSQDGERVAICDRLGDGDKWRNVAKLDLADVVAPELMGTWLTAHKSRLKAIVHLGAISSTTERNVDLILQENYRLSRDLWQFCTTENIRFVYASSAATYGDGSRGFDDDGSVAKLARLRPLNPYGWSKHLFDRFVAREVAANASLPPQWVGLKFFNVYGPNEYHKGPMKSVVAQIYGPASRGQAVTLFRSHNPAFVDGGQRRDFVYVDDCADVVAWLLENPGVGGLYNLGTGQARSFLDLAHAVFASLGREPSINFVDTPSDIREKYQYFTQADMSRLRSAGYARPFTALETGIADYLQNYLLASDPYR